MKLWGSAGEIQLTVSDLGVGFDSEAAMKSTGLGLTSMQERLRLVGGKLSIDSPKARHHHPRSCASQFGRIMRKRFSSNLGTGLRFSFWPTALIGIVVIKAVLSLDVKPGSFLLSYSGISYFLLLLLATSFAIRNGIQNTLGRRPFWVFLAIAYGLWALHQCLTLYYELGRHIEAPDSSIADPSLFLHIVPLMAAAATLPHQNVSDRKLYRAILNSLLLLFFWSFLYGYIVFPYQYFPNATSYALRFDILYLLENLALVLVVGVLTLRAQAPWKSIYLHLLGASTLYALSSTVANLAIDSGGYVNGKLYGLGLTASVCWFVWIPLRARQVKGEATAMRSDRSQSSRGSVWAMLVVVMVSIPIIWELFQRNENIGLRHSSPAGRNCRDSVSGECCLYKGVPRQT